MNVQKIQLEIFKQMLLGNKVTGGVVSDGEIAVTYDGFRAFRLPIKSICFDRGKIVEFQSISEIFKLSESDVKLKRTDSMKVVGGRTAVLFIPYESEKSELRVWIDKRYLIGTEDMTAYAVSPLQVVKFTDCITGSVSIAVMPVRVKEDDDNENR